MRRILLYILSLLPALICQAQSIRMLVRKLPENHPPGSAIYLAGSFNKWNPQEEQFRFRLNETGQYSLLLSIPPGKHEYKITRGGWDKVEVKKNGAGINNRQLITGNDTLLLLDIEGWQDQFSSIEKKTTASKQVSILDTAFYMTSLNRKRTIRIYLPPGYDDSKKKYPVLYMQDGQNLFDDQTSFAGEWGVDEMLDTAIFRQCIVVGIDHGGPLRLKEYSPFDFSLQKDSGTQTKGEGKLYAAFLAKQLKPYIDQRFRTLASVKNTFVAGSSMGGLIALYTILDYPKVFGGAAVLSPSVWICKKELLERIRQKNRNRKTRIFFYAGKKESESMVPDMLAVFEQCRKVSKAGISILIRDEGTHSEASWRRELPFIFDWLLGP